MQYRAPLDHMLFLLRDVFHAQSLWRDMPVMAELTFDDAKRILEEGAKLAGDVLSPLNRSGDEEGVHWYSHGVETPEGFVEAWKLFAEGGWAGVAGDPAFDGQGLPKSLVVLLEEMLYSANTSFALYAALTSGVALTLQAHGSGLQKQLYLPKLHTGEWTGTMCLTEAHAGSDLGILRTRAEPQADGTHRITGTKIFITGGDHDLTTNIIHLVLARLPDAPAGPRGISLFLVPKILVNQDGTLAEKNSVSCASTERKMGIHASSTCVMNFDAATGFMVGEPNQGLACMFTMMNHERLSIGLQGTGCAEMSLQQAASYAMDRLQGRAADGAFNSSASADPIIVHADVRRMLMIMRALVEAGRAFSVYVAQFMDISRFHPDAGLRAAAALRVALLIPIAKAFFTDKGFDACVLGQQVFGGHGYVRDNGQEQLVRDARIAQIYEGTNGIQAQDLLKRKIIADKGAAMQSLLAEIRKFSHVLPESCADFTVSLDQSTMMIERMTAHVIKSAGTNLDSTLASACDYLHACGYLLYAYMWAMMAAADVNNENNLRTGRFFLHRMLPQLSVHFAIVMKQADDLGLPASWLQDY